MYNVKKLPLTGSVRTQVILFGEHSVVHGRSAVAATLGRRLTVTLSPLEDSTLHLSLPDVGLPELVLSLPSTEDDLKYETAFLSVQL